jgi:tRNA pseudouridine55 synthase
MIADGVLVVDKPVGMTSHDVVERLRRRFLPGRVGHTGTLDPFATGVLVAAFNQATRLTDILGTGAKVYQATLELGRATDTGDLSGQTKAEAPVPELNAPQVEAALAAMVGPRMQAPPAYSAAKHEGRPLYAYARQGQVVSKPARPITVYEARLLGVGQGRIEFVMRVTRGTYVRALAEDLAHALGTEGHLVALRRLAAEPFGLDQAHDLQEALDMSEDQLGACMLSPSQALAACGVPALVVDEDLAWQIRQGRIIATPVLLGQMPAPVPGPLRVLTVEGEMVAVLRWLATEQARPGRAYETIRVFPEHPQGGAQTKASASAANAE